MYEQKHHYKALENLSVLITGGAGFIGSNIVEYLLKSGVKKVVVLDNLLTGFIENTEIFKDFPNYDFIHGDITDLDTCRKACEGIDIICHQAALGSVPRSVAYPEATTKHNIDGFVNMVVAAREKGIKRFVYASSSSVYGDEPNLPKVEHRIGKPLSPYAISKYTNELFAQNFGVLYGMEFIGFRYFNVFGPRQSPKGVYAAVIPLFVDACMTMKPAFINGDGLQTRDFTFVENVVQINVKAMTTDNENAYNQVYNVGCGSKYTVLDLFNYIKEFTDSALMPSFRAEREGDIRNSLADITKAQTLLGYDPAFSLKDGLKITTEFFKNQVFV